MPDLAEPDRKSVQRRRGERVLRAAFNNRGPSVAP